MTESSDGRRVYVIATTIDDTRHAIEVGQTLATGEHCELAVVAAPPERMTVSSGRAHVYDLPADTLDPHPRATVQSVRELAESLAPPAEVVVTPSISSQNLARLLPHGATLVVCGRVRRLLEAPEQRLARELSKEGYDVIFLPHRDPSRPSDTHTRADTMTVR